MVHCLSFKERARRQTTEIADHIFCVCVCVCVRLNASKSLESDN